MVSSIKRVYWDSCTFLGLINEEAGKHSDSLAVWNEAEAGKIEIVTSFLSFAEVFKAKCEGPRKPLDETEEDRVARFLESEIILPIPVDRRTALLSRKLMRRHSECKKPTDGIHLATAILLNVDELHTFDGSDLLPLDNRVARQDGVLLKICTPYMEEPKLL